MALIDSWGPGLTARDPGWGERKTRVDALLHPKTTGVEPA
jgi:hypothetical protein